MKLKINERLNFYCNYIKQISQEVIQICIDIRKLLSIFSIHVNFIIKLNWVNHLSHCQLYSRSIILFVDSHLMALCAHWVSEATRLLRLQLAKIKKFIKSFNNYCFKNIYICIYHVHLQFCTLSSPSPTIVVYLRFTNLALSLFSLSISLPSLCSVSH